MGLIDRLKSALGFGDSVGPGSDASRSGNRDVDVTVEHEPSTASEDAVKGTDTAQPGAGSGAGADRTPESGTDTDTGAGIDIDSGTDTGTAPSPGAPAGDGESVSDETTTAVEADLQDIKGIGPAYADRLRAAGVDSVADLAAADPDALDEETGIGPTRLGTWIERARQR